MAEIRNLTRNGETFYPLTVADAVSDPSGEYIGYYMENSEWIKVVADHDGKILVGIKANGEIEWSLGIPTPIKDYISETLLNKVDKEEGKSLIEAEYASSINYTKNLEYISAELDNEEKVVSSRDKDGILHENVGIKTPKILLSKEGLDKLSKELDINKTDILSLYPPQKIVPLLENFKTCTFQHGNSYEGLDGGSVNVQPYFPLTFMWFSDIHQDSENLKRIKKFYDKYKDNIDDVIFTGDTVSGTYSAAAHNYWHECGADSFLFVIGNHDAAYTLSPYKPVSPKKAYDVYLKNFLTDTGIICEENKNYWYKDYTFAKSHECHGGIRFIALDQYHWKEGEIFDVDSYDDGSPVDNGEQAEWLENLLQDALENEFAVIISLHGACVNYTDIECSFNTLHKVGNQGYASTSTEILDIVQNFIDAGGEFITWMCGHWHQDWFGNITNYSQQTQIVVNTASHLVQWREQHLIPDTNSADCFDIISIEPKQKFIRLVRIGIEFDRNGRHVGTLLYDYKNKKLISNF